jgi:hypothetical protein
MLEPEMLKLILESNYMQFDEMKVPKTEAETKKVAKRVRKFVGDEQDKKVRLISNAFNLHF